jgi:nitrate reductase NapE component
MFGACVLGMVVAVASLVSDGLSLWAIGAVAFCGLGIGVFEYQLATGRPSLTVTLTGLSVNNDREVPFPEVRELYTSLVAFGIVYPPRSGEQLRGPWQRSHGLKYRKIAARGVVDAFQLAQWILQLIDPAREVETEPRFGRSVWVVRLGQSVRP